MADEHVSDESAEETPAVRTPQEAWQLLYDLGQETGWTFPHFTEWERPDGVTEDQLWADAVTDRRIQDLKVLDAHLALLQYDESPDKQETSVYRDWAKSEREICDRIIKLLSGVDWAYLDDIDVFRDGLLGEERGFGDLEDLRQAARQRAEFLRSVRPDTLSLKELSDSVRRPTHQYVHGLRCILEFPKDGSAEENSASAQLSAGRDAETAFGNVLTQSASLYVLVHAAGVDGLRGDLREVGDRVTHVDSELRRAHGELSEGIEAVRGDLGALDVASVTTATEDAQRLVPEAGRTIEEVKKEWATVKPEVDTALKEMRKRLEEKSIAEHASEFASRAEANRKGAIGAFGVAAALVVAGLVLGPMALDDLATVATKLQGESSTKGLTDALLRPALQKGFVFSVFFYVLYQATRILRAQLHQVSVNRHRSAALSTYKAFSEAAAAYSEEAREQILMQATRAIFEFGVSGYVSQQDKGGVGGIIQIATRQGARAVAKDERDSS